MFEGMSRPIQSVRERMKRVQEVKEQIDHVLSTLEEALQYVSRKPVDNPSRSTSELQGTNTLSEIELDLMRLEGGLSLIVARIEEVIRLLAI
jgi:hypothetical protein